MSFGERDLFSKRCEHLDLVTLPITDMFGNLIFNIHHYHRIYEGIKSEEITAERNDKILSIISVGEGSDTEEVAKLKTYMATTATAILAKIDISLFNEFGTWSSKYDKTDF